MKKKEIMDKSNPISINISKDFNLKKKDFENIGNQLKTMTENKYQGINVDVEVKNDGTDDLTLYLSNCQNPDCKDVEDNNFRNFISDAINNIMNKDYNAHLGKIIDLTNPENLKKFKQQQNLKKR